MNGLARNQHGSMFIMVLLILLILTAVALSLVFVTEIEMQLGGTERVMNLTFFAAETGVHAALAGVPNQNWAGEKLVFPEGPGGGPGRQLGTRVITTRVRTVGPPQLPPMTIANEGENDYHTFATFLRSTAQRVSWPQTEQVPIYDEGDLRELDVTIQSQQTLEVRYLLSPVRTPPSPEQPYSDETDRGFGAPPPPPPPPTVP
ncbi:MAG TPA: PilX N-terminal domain-containing pilus assembly protein [Thermoanaerobaculia bacterium]|jgi:hypothetical protein